MILKYYFCVSVVLIVLSPFNFSNSQLVDQAIETTDTPLEPETYGPSEPGTVASSEPETPSDVICSVCACADGVVDCVNLNLTTPFEITDWDGLASFNPITVNLSQNPLTSVSRIGKLPIQVLNFSNCDIEMIEDASFMYLDKIRSIDLSGNKISTSGLSRRSFIGPLDPKLGPQNFKQMTDLRLAHNDIHSLPQDIFFFMTFLTFLDLSGNPLAYIDQVTLGTLSDLVNLRHLKLSNCELEALPEGLLRRLRKLRYLDLSDNRFTTVPDTLQEAPKLISLSLDRNPIQVIDAQSSISNLTKLQELSLCRMSRLQNITSGALGGLTSLIVLRLNHNPRLTNLASDFLVSVDEDGEQQWPLVKELYLNNNNLSSINSHFLEGWNDLVAGDFSNNPYVCDCNCQWMVDVLIPLMGTTPQHKTIHNMVCKKPAELRGLTFAQLNNSSKILVCAESENLTEQAVGSNLAIILGFMIGIIVTFPIVLVVVLLWKRGYFARCRSQRKASYYDDENEYL